MLYQNLIPVARSSSMSISKSRRKLWMIHRTNYNVIIQATSYFSSSHILEYEYEHCKKYRRRHRYSNSDVYFRSLSNTSNNDNSNDTTNPEETKSKIKEKPKIITVDSSTHQQFQWQNKTYRYNPSISDNVNVDAYRMIAMKQAEAAKKSRDATTRNVRRALYGNIAICFAKLGAWMSCGSSAMLSEFIHSLVDCGNQGLLLIGLRDSALLADRRHPYGYGKSVYFWALVSALGTFWLGAGVSMRHSIEELLYPSVSEISWQVWAVLGVSLTIDGYVLIETIKEINRSRPKGSPFWTHVWNIRDPATIAILLEDGAACLGIVICSTGIALTHVTNMPIFDGMAGVAVSSLLAGMGLILVRLNRRFLLGQAVDPDIVAEIEKILLRRRSIDSVHSVQSQWTGPDNFSYKASIDFDGTYLAARLIPRYQNEFLKLTQVSNEQEVKDSIQQDLPLLLSWYAEDVVRTVEKEVRVAEAEIRRKYPGATYIELEPDSKFSNRYAVDDGMEAQLKTIEMEALSKYLKSLYIDQLGNTAKKKDDDSNKDDNKKE